jgi:Xaa-Pro aminopeptidase
MMAAAAMNRIRNPISTAELERRWHALRTAMAAENIDVLVMQNNNDHMGGYVKYVTDLPAVSGYPFTVVFPADDLMTLVRMGAFGGELDLSHGNDPFHRGVKRILMTPSFASAPYTNDYDAELAAKALAPYAKGTIGLVGKFQMSAAFAEILQKTLTSARFVDATDMVDRIKVVKSPEEFERIRETARLQDAAMRAAFAAIKPGMRDCEVAAVAQYYSHCRGSEQGVYKCGSAPAGTAYGFKDWHFQNRVIREGDQFQFLVENNGPGGYFTELGRTCIVGRASNEIKDEFAFTLEARQFVLDRLKPGTPCKEIWADFNDMMKRNGRPQESRLNCHGQGYDMVERPLVRIDEPLEIQANTNIVVHPTYVHRGMWTWICDNYLIGPNGPVERFHESPEEITELG